MSYILTNVLSASPINSNVGYNNSWIQVDTNAGRPLFAEASYITNFDDLVINLSASDVTIGNVHIADSTTGLHADVADIGIGMGALRVLSQDLESNVDDVTIGDRSGNLAYITLSALNVFVTNSINAVSVTNQLTSTSVIVLNPVSSFYLVNSSIEISNDVGNPVPVNVTNSLTMEPTQLDAFGRLRISAPITLFDSSHRYTDNNLWASLTAVGGSYTFNQNQGLMDLTVSSLSGSSVIRETTKVFSYQPGKSLLVMNTFVMASSATNLRQRVGYFENQNGIYLQLDDGNIGLIKRSLVSGSVVDTVVSRSDWNGDKLDGTGASGLTLDITKAQILWLDIEWLGVGSVRIGFIINGRFIVCHTFHHANIIDSTYITTASLPLRYEITNKGATSGSKTLKQICSTVISEGGYDLRGMQQAVGTSIITPKNLSSPAGSFFPVVTIRLKTTRKDAIVIPTAVSLLGKDVGDYNWRIVLAGITSGGSGTWISTGDDSSVEYKLDATSITGGRILASGFFTTGNQGTTEINLSRETLFKFQLERDSLNNINYELSLVVASNDTNKNLFGSIDWEEVSR